MHVLITEDLYDKKFVEENCEDFEALKAMVMEYPAERASKISGVPVETIREIARTMASIKPGMLCYTLGITEHTCGKNNVMSTSNLQMLLGNMGMGTRASIRSADRTMFRAPATWARCPECTRDIRRSTCVSDD